MKALVTGCAGFIGSHLTESLLADGHQVVGVDCFNDNYGRARKLRNLDAARDWDAFDFVPIDLSRGQLRGVVADCDAVFHLAAEPGVRPSWGRRFENYVLNNIVATQHLVEASSEFPERPFVYASSSSIYGQAERFPTPETAYPRPHSPYGVTKLAAEQLCLAYHANYGASVVALRYFSVYGPRQRPDMAFDRFCRAALDGSPIVVYGDGLQTRDFTFIEDVVRATRSAAETPEAVGDVYNIGGGSRISLRDALALLEELSGRNLDVTFEQVQAGDVRDSGADTSQARAHLSFVPEWEFVRGLSAQFDWVRAQQAVGT
jgi:nucleoside-diphosphate-sugar epimerase